ncbi:MAG: ArsB/NhaD family transporter [Anaerolineaceae bacterium]|nr:ArsB/NhaD family transporter [Anaerolineaceae bacterium]
MTAAVVSSVIFFGTLGLIFSEKVNRTIIAIFGASAMIGFGMVFNFYSEEQAIETIDVNTLGLLMGMMILVALLQPTGFFQYIAILVGKLSKGRPVRLMVLLGTATTILSMFLDNVTTVVLIAPVTILICEILGLSAMPFLMAEAMLSNTGGVATLVGDPPNILIGSAAGLSFNDFLAHSFPIVLVVWFVALLILWRSFLPTFTKEFVNDPEALAKLNPSGALKDRKTTKKVLIVIGLAVVSFLLEDLLHVSPAFVALAAAGIGLLWVQPDIRDVLHHVEWDILIFFGALFVMVGGLEEAGVLQLLADVIAKGSILPTVWQGIILLWIVAILSAIVDNIPITIALIPVIHGLETAGMDVSHLWWALAFGAGFGGNGTIIGSTANVVVTSLSERTRTPITPGVWLKHGLPVMFATCLVASGLYALVSLTIGW